MEITMVAVPYNRIFGIGHTFPFAVPYVIPFTSVLTQEGRINRITQYHVITFADECRVILCQFRNDGQMTLDDTVASALGRVIDVTEITLLPDRIRIDATYNER